MDVDSRKNEEKGASKTVDLEIEVRREYMSAGDVHSNIFPHAGFAKQISGDFVRHAI
jgi:hypothetical protein